MSALSTAKKVQALRLERFRMHGAIFALGIVLGAHQACATRPTPAPAPLPLPAVKVPS